MRTARTTGRLTAAAASLLITALALTACGRADSPTDATTVEVDDKAASGTVDVWTAGDLGTQTRAVFDQFAAENDGVKVTVTDVPWTEIDNKMQNATAAGTVPDLVLIGDTASLIAAGGLQTVPKDLVDSSLLNATALARTQDQKGQQFGVPWYVETRVLFSHKAAVAAAGVSAPKTWQDQLDYFAAIAKVDGVKQAVALPVGADQPHQLILSFLAQAGGSALTADGRSWSLDTPAMVEALTYYAEFFNRKLASPDGYGDDLLPNFLGGATDSMIQGVFLIPAVNSAMKDQGLGEKWSENNLVASVLASGSASNASYLGGASWVVPAASDNAASAWKLVRWLEQPEQQLALFQKTRNIPANTQVWTDPAMTSDPWITTALTQLNATVSDPSAPAWREIAKFIDKTSEKIIHGSLSPKDAAAQIQQQAEKTGLGW